MKSSVALALGLPLVLMGVAVAQTENSVDVNSEQSGRLGAENPSPILTAEDDAFSGTLTEDDANSSWDLRLETTADGGFRVESVARGSLAAAELRSNDVIISVDGRSFDTEAALRTYLREQAGDRMEMLVLRDGEHVSVQMDGDRSGPDSNSSSRPALGVRFFRGPALHVIDVVEGSPADRAGVVAGDVIISMNGNRFASTDAFIAAVAAADVNQDVELVFDRRGQIVVATVPFASWDSVYDTPDTTVTALRPDLDADDYADVITAPRHVHVHPAAYGYYGHPSVWTHCHHHSYYGHYHWPVYAGPYFYAPYPGPIYYGPAYTYWPVNVSWRYPVYSAYVR